MWYNLRIYSPFLEYPLPRKACNEYLLLTDGSTISLRMESFICNLASVQNATKKLGYCKEIYGRNHMIGSKVNSQ